MTDIKLSDYTNAKFDLGLDQVSNVAPLALPISTATQAALDLKLDATAPVITKATGAGSGLDIRNTTTDDGNLQRWYSGTVTTRPTMYVNGGGHLHTVGSILVSGVWNQLEGDACQYLSPNNAESYMFASWADTAGPVIIIRSNQYAGQPGFENAYPALYMSGTGKYVLRIEDDGSLHFGHTLLKTGMDTRLWRKAAGVLSVGDGTKDNESGTIVAKVLAGDGIELRTGTNARMGRATLVGGTVTVANTSVTVNTNVLLQRQIDGGTVSASYSVSRTAGTNFVITGKDGVGATNTTDTSELCWQLIEPYVYTLLVGPEQVTNGTFDTDITGWAVYPTLGPSVYAWDNTGQRLHTQNTTTADRGLFGQIDANGFAVTAGKSYRVRATMVCVSGKTFGLSINKVSYNAARLILIDNNKVPGTYTYDDTWNPTVSETVHFTGDYQNLVGDCYLDNISVEELL